MFIDSIKYKAWVWILAIIAASMSISIFSTNFFQFALIFYWLFMPGIRLKFSDIKAQKGLWVFLSGYVVLLIGMIYTSDFNYGLHDLKIKLPLLILPLIIGTSKKINFQELRFVLMAFIAGIFLSSIISTGVFLGLGDLDVVKHSDISIFISHVRFSLLVVLAFFFSAYYFLKEDDRTKKILLGVLPLWFAFFLFILHSFTGIIILFILTLITVTVLIKKSNELMVKVFGYIAIITVLLLSASYITKCIGKFYNIDIVNIETLPTHTALGNEYKHHTNLTEIENGHYVWLYYSKEEMTKAWNKTSKIKVSEKDKRGQTLKYTLIKYLTSKNLTKDEYGISQLSKEDISNIENGLTNYIYAKKYSLYPRIYQIIWEFDQYKKTGNPSGHSVSQRIEYLKTGLSIIKENLFIGTGTGDVKQAFTKKYDEQNSKLSNRWRLRTHNQFITFTISSGIIGFILIMISWFYPVFYEKRWSSFLFLIFFATALLSMLNEDTLETSTGVTFFAFFYALLLFGHTNEQ